MKKTIGFIGFILAFSFSSIGQVSISKNAKVENKARQEINKKAEDVRQKEQDIKTAKKEAIQKHKDGKAQIKNVKKEVVLKQKGERAQMKSISKEAKEKYLSLKKEEVDALPIAKKAEAKRAIIEKKVNTSDMKSASAQMKISGVKTRLKKGLEAGTISESEYKIKMEKVAKAEASLKAYRASIKTGKAFLK